MLYIGVFSVTAFAQNARIFYDGSIRAKGSTVTVCKDVSVVFSDSSIIPVSGSWRFKGGTPATATGISPSVSFAANGLDTIFLFGSDTTFIKVQVVSPVSDFAFTPNNACAGTTVDFTSTSTGTGPFSYNWNFGGITGAPAGSSDEDPGVSFSPLAGSGSTGYSVVLTTTDINGCSANSSAQTVTVNQLPDPRIIPAIGIGGNFTIAPGGNSDLFRKCTASTPNLLTIQNTSSTISSNTNYTVEWGDSTSDFISPAFSSSTSHSYINLGSYSLNLTVNSNNGCSATKTYQIFIGNTPSAPLITRSNVQGECVPKTYVFDILNVASNPAGTTYRITSNEGIEANYSHPPPLTYTKSYLNNSCGSNYVAGSATVNNSYYLKIEASNSCGSQEGLAGPIQFNSRPIADFSIDADPGCANQNIIFTNTSIKGNAIDASPPYTCDTTDYPDWIINPGSGWNLANGAMQPPGVATNNITVSFLASGVYSIKLHVQNPINVSCGVDSITKTICIQPIPVPSFTCIPSPLSRCAPVVLTFANTSNTLTSCGNTTYTWSFPNGAGPVFTSGTSANSIHPVIQFNVAGMYVVRLSITNQCGTVNHDSTIVIKGFPVTVLQPDRPYCDSQTLAFNNTNGQHDPFFNANAGVLSYQWNITPAGATFVSGTNDTLANPVVRFAANATTAVVYTVKIIATNECGSASDSQLVTINPPVSPPLTRDTSRCGPGGITLTATIGTNGNNLKWHADSTGNGILSTGVFYSPVGVSSTQTYYVRSFNSLTTCESRAVPITVRINPIPDMPFVTGANKCGPASALLTGTPGTNGNKLRWYTAASGGTAFHSGNSYTTPVLSTTTSYFVSSFDSITNCESAGRQMVTVTIDSLPVVFAGNDTSFCNVNTNITLVNYTPPLSGLAGTGVWSGGAITGSGIFNPMTAGVGSHILIYTFIKAGTGCLNKDTLLVSVISAASSDAGSDFAVCRNSGSIALAAAPAGGVWTNGGSTITGGLFNPVTAGVFDLVYTIGTGSCQSRDTVLITVDELPDPDFVLAAGVCPNQSASLTATNTNGTAAVSYMWKIRNSRMLPNTIISDSTIQNPVLLFPENQATDTAYYFIKLVIVTDNGCADSVTKGITLNKRPEANFNITGDVCGMTALNITNLSSNNPTSWAWSVSPSGAIINNNLGEVPGITLPVNVMIDSVNYSIILIATLSGIGANCSDTVSKPYTIYPRPVAGFVVSHETGCTPLEASFINTSNARNNELRNTMNFVWSKNGINISTDSIPSPQLLLNPSREDSTTGLRLIATTQHGCKDTVSKNITVFPEPESDISAVIQSSCPPFLIDGSVISLVTYPQSNDTYIWNILTGNRSSTISSVTGTTVPSHSILNPTDSVIYQLITTNAHGCRPDTMEIKFHTIANPVAAFSMSDSTGCSVLNVNFNSLSSSGVNLQWNFSNGQMSTSATPSVNFINLSNTLDSIYFARLTITTAGLGCRDSITDTIRVYPNPRSVFGFSQPHLCPSTTVAVTNSSVSKNASATYSWKILNSETVHISDTADAAPDIFIPDNQSNADSIFSVRLRSVSIDGCAHEEIDTFTRLRRPLVQFTIPANGCGPFSLNPSNITGNIPVSELNWLWSVAPVASVGIVSTNSLSPSITLPVNNTADSLIYDVKLIATRITGGCTDTLSRKITIYPKPDVAFTSSQDNGCTPLEVSFANTTIARNNEPVSSMSFVWSINNNNVSADSVIMPQSITNPGPEDSTVAIRLIGTSSHGCKDTASRNLTVYPNPISQFTGPSASSCAPFLLNSSLISATEFPDANDIYTWKILSGNKSTTLISVSGIIPPDYTILSSGDSIVYQLITSNIHGCIADTMEMMFRTITNPVAAFSMSDSTGCSELNVNFNNLSSPGVNLDWRFSNGQTSTSANPSVNFINLSNTLDSIYFAKLIITTSGSGCRDSITDTIRVYPNPKSDFSIIQSNLCPLSTVSLNNTSIFKWPAATFNWTVLNSDIVSISNDADVNPDIFIPDNQSNSDSTFSVRLHSVSINGCVHDEIDTFTRLRRPDVRFTVPANGCGPFLFSPSNTTANIPVSELNWLWTVTPNTSVSLILHDSQSPSVTLPENTAADSLIYNVKLIATRITGGCTDTLSHDIIVYPRPIVDFSLSHDAGCTPLDVTFTNTTDPRNNESAGSMNFGWAVNAAHISSGQVLLPQVFANPLQHDSILNVRLIGTTMHGCVDTVNKSIEIHPDAEAAFSFVRNISCAPFVINEAIINAELYSEANSSYLWFINDSLIGKNPVFPGYTITEADDSVYIKLKTISIKGCKNDSQTVVFKTISNPRPDFNFTDSIGCMPFQFSVNNTSTPITGLTYEWLAGIQTSSLKNPVFSGHNYGVTDTVINIKLVVVAVGSGCRDSVEKQVVVKPLPDPDFNIIPAVRCFPQPVRVQNISSAPPSLNNNGYIWSVSGPESPVILNDTSNTFAEIIIPDNQSGVSRNYEVTLIATSSFGCIDSIRKNINTPTRPVADFSFSKDSSCSYETITTNNNSLYADRYTWVKLSGSLTITYPGDENTSVIMPPHTGAVDSIYYVKLIVINASECSDSISKTFVSLPKPIAVYNTDTNIGCAPLTVSFNNSTTAMLPVQYLWKLESNVSDTSSHPLYTFGGSLLHDTIYHISMIATSSGGCSDTAVQYVTVKSSAAARVQTTDSVYCMNTFNEAAARILNASFGDVDSFFYDFGDSTELMTTSDTGIVHSYHYEGTYKIRMMAKNNCKMSYDSISIKILRAPEPLFLLSDTLGCSPFTVKFQNNTVNYEASYFWDFGNGLSSNDKHPDSVIYYQSRINDTAYIVKLTVANSCGIRSLYDTVRVLPVPVPSFLTSIDSGCSPLPVSFINTTTGKPSFVKWYFGTGDSSTRYDPYPQTYRTEDSATIYKIKMVASNMCGIDSAFKSIIVQPNTVRAFFTTSGAQGCAPFKVKFFGGSIGGEMSWNLGEGTTSNSKDTETVYYNPGDYIARHYVNNGCSYDTASVPVRVDRKPEFTISKSKLSACVGESISFNAALVDSGVITWDFGDGETSSRIIDLHKYKTEGKKIIKAVLKSHTNICLSVLFDSLTINPVPKVEIKADTGQACVYNEFKFNSGASSGVYYSWNTGDANGYTGTTASHTYALPGKYTVTLVAETDVGCIDSATRQVTVFERPDADFIYDPLDTCTGPVEVIFTNKSIGSKSSLWTFGNGLNTTIKDPVITYSSVGNYDVSLIAGNEYDCFDTAFAVYHVYNVPVASFTFIPQHGCEPLEVYFTNTSVYGDSLFWSFGDGATSVSLNPFHKYEQPGIYDVNLTVVEGGICADVLTKADIIEVYPKPVAEFTAQLNPSVRPYSLVQTTNQSKGATKYIWNFGDNLGSSEETGPQYRYPQYGDYRIRLIAISDKDCMDTSFYGVSVPKYNKGLYVPNAFTPGYGQPEVQKFKPVGIELREYHLKIYDKWGGLIWETKEITEKGEPKEAWDGLDKNGVECVQGAYVWSIIAIFTDGETWPGMVYPAGSQKPVTSGNVTLIR